MRAGVEQRWSCHTRARFQQLRGGRLRRSTRQLRVWGQVLCSLGKPRRATTRSIRHTNSSEASQPDPGRKTVAGFAMATSYRDRGADEAPCCSTTTRRAAVIKRWQPHTHPADSEVFPWYFTLLLRWRPKSVGMERNQGWLSRPSRQQRGSRSRGDDGVTLPQPGDSREESRMSYERNPVRVCVRPLLHCAGVAPAVRYGGNPRGTSKTWPSPPFSGGGRDGRLETSAR